MEKLFRLKKEAQPYFKDHLSEIIIPVVAWKAIHNVSESALEEVDRVTVRLGAEWKDADGVAISRFNQWKQEYGGSSTFNFTVKVLNTEYNTFTKLTSKSVMDIFLAKFKQAVEEVLEDVNMVEEINK